MFRTTALIRATSLRTRTVAIRRNFCAEPKREVSKVPSRGQSEGGHPKVLPKSLSLREWLSEPAAWPIILITSVAVVFGTYKLFKVDAKSPELHFSKKERGSLDYIDNQGNEEKAKKWAEQTLIPGQVKGQHLREKKE